MPRAIWALGFVSLLMDVSSELIHSLLPVFMFTALGLSAFTIGLVEGQPLSDFSNWLGLMVIFDALFLVVAVLTFDFVVEE